MEDYTVFHDKRCISVCLRCAHIMHTIRSYSVQRTPRTGRPRGRGEEVTCRAIRWGLLLCGDTARGTGQVVLYSGCVYGLYELL